MDSMDGNTAATHVAYALSEFCFIFPITPSSTMAEHADAWSAQGKKNCFGTVPAVIQMESEGGVAGALHGSGASGGLCSSFTSSQGLLLMIPNLYKLAGELIPCVLHLAARQVGSSGTSIYGDESDAMSIRHIGCAMMCSGCPQEVMDLALVSHLAALNSSVPFVHFFDGFQTSHTISSVSPIPYDQIASLIPHDKVSAHRKRALNPMSPHQRGAVVGREDWFPATEAMSPVYEGVVPAVERALRDVATLTGRTYSLFDYAGAPDAEIIVVALGAGALATEETVLHLNSTGYSKKVGVIRVHLFRPWSIKHFMATLPPTTRIITTLDRTKEIGAIGEPLYMDVVASLMEVGRTGVRVLGGRYGLADFAFTPAMVKATYDNMLRETPLNHFTVGINDDVMHRSLPLGPEFSASGEAMQCSFWGMGSDGTVGANQMTIRMVGRNTKRFAHGMFFYSTHKSGGVTVSHLRFAPSAVKATYPITQADFIALSQHSYLAKYPILKTAKEGSIFLFNSPHDTVEALQANIPANVLHTIAERHIKFYTIDALKIATECGLGGHTNLVMQVGFFKLCPDLMPLEVALGLMKDNVRTVYAKKGDVVINKNITAMERAISELKLVNYPVDQWLALPSTVPRVLPPNLAPFVREIKVPLMFYESETVPVSAYQRLNYAGTVPNTTTRVEKRGIAVKVPTWDVNKCVQCTLCSIVCPHAVIRPYLLTQAEADAAPNQPFATKPAVPKTLGEYKFRIQISPLDCTGCGQCVNQCPVKALSLVPLETVAPKECANWEYTQTLPARELLPADTIKGSQLKQPLFEFNGACAGCGEAPYIKLLSQLFGDRAVFGCSSGCNVAYSFCFGVNPYCTKPNGRGPATAHSLFEDTAEFTYGIAKTNQIRREHLSAKIMALESNTAAPVTAPLRTALSAWVAGRNNTETSEQQMAAILPLLEAEHTACPELEAIWEMKNLLPKLTHWAIGGDGWANDIDFGGLDHVLLTGCDMKALVLDTEVYSNTGGQKSKATPKGSVHKFEAKGKASHKKDLGLIFMSYENIYVASVALFANPAQALRAICEAEAYPGPAVVIAYSPCIEHGIEGVTWLEQTKLAVDSGYWPLYRYNPLLRAQGKNPFVYESPENLRGSARDFLAHENRFQRLVREHPETAAVLHADLVDHIAQRHQSLLKKAKSEP
ncbi:pyruvate:ferredoxin oxidoreductase [Pelomyxa schiedti]|nr:pyruvate:ferredoxin oxidoreductase [Pelomyxa schiedti]